MRTDENPQKAHAEQCGASSPSGGASWDDNVSEYGRDSLWRDTATAGPERARDLAARLERRAKAVDEVAARDAYLGLLDIAAGERGRAMRDGTLSRPERRGGHP
jgi:hypothetical protein